MKKIIIIGGGISGLTAGIYARKAGFETEIYESHVVAGGECTGWNRKGYHIDGCIHWLTGSKKGSDLYTIWETTGALGDNVKVHDNECFAVMPYNGEVYRLYMDLDKLEKELLRISPEDKSEIKNLIENIRLCQKLPVPAKKPMEFMNIMEKISFMSKYMKVGKIMKDGKEISVNTYLSRFHSEAIKYLFKAVMPDNMPLNTFFVSLGIRTSGNAGQPLGGSYQFAQRMKDRFEEMGGKLLLNTPVKEIIVKNGKATGIILQKNNEIKTADYIVPATDAFVLINNLLATKFKDKYFENRFNAPGSYPLLSATFIALGIKSGMRSINEDVLLKFKNPIKINNSTHDSCLVKQFSHDPIFSTNEKSLLTVTINDSEFDYWDKLKKESIDSYNDEKDRIATRIIDEIENLYPEIKGTIEMKDVATPLTFHRYCNAYKGAYMSFTSLPNVVSENHKGTIEGIENMYLAGQWVFPDGGLPMAAVAGKFAIQRICKKEKINLKLLE